MTMSSTVTTVTVSSIVKSDIEFGSENSGIELDSDENASDRTNLL